MGLELKSKLKKEQEMKAEKYTFNIHPLLSGYLRGRGGSNIDRVKHSLNGKIIRIEPQNGSCYIAAKDKMSLNAAIDQLQIVCKKVVIPYDEMGQIIGSQGKQIQDIKRKAQVIKVISWSKWPDEFKTLQEIQKSRYKYMQSEQSEDVPDIIKNATLDNIFDADQDIIDLSPHKKDEEETNECNEEITKQNDRNDALVIIGRKSRVKICIFMIEMTLNHFRGITKTRNNVRLLRKKINEIKGNPVPISYEREQRERGYNQYNHRERGYASHQRQRERGYQRGRGYGGRESQRNKRSQHQHYQQKREHRHYQKRERYREHQQYDDGFQQNEDLQSKQHQNKYKRKRNRGNRKRNRNDKNSEDHPQ